MSSLGKDINSTTYPVVNMTAALAGVTTNAGRATDILALGGRPNSVVAVIAVRANLDDADTCIVDNVKLVSDSVSNFAGAVTRVTASDITLTGVTGDTNVDYWSEARLSLDLTQLPLAHRYIRVSARTTMSDTTNTSGQIAGVLVFGGHQESPQA